MLAIGLMSGTSLDGIDAALVKINGCGTETDVQLMEMLTLPIGEELKERIKTACDPVESNVPLICQLNTELGYQFLKACQILCQKAGIEEKALILLPATDKRSGTPPMLIHRKTAPCKLANLRLLLMAYKRKSSPISE